MQPGDLAYIRFIGRTGTTMYAPIEDPEAKITRETPRITLHHDANGTRVVYLGDMWLSTGKYNRVLFNGTVGVIHSGYVSHSLHTTF